MARRYNILFVEDDHAMRDLVVEILSMEGFDVITAADGYEAIRILTERPVDLLFTDIVMPGLSGFQLAQQAKLIRPSLRVLYMTAHPDRAAGRDGARHGRLLEKPVRASEIVSRVRESLAI